MTLLRNPTFFETIVEMIRANRPRLFLSAVNLGGSGGQQGGSGSPPGGIIGQLTQSRVAYDTTEAATQIGNSSLLDNLNHIRAELYERSWWGL